MHVRYSIALWLALAVALVAQTLVPERATGTIAFREIAQPVAAAGLTVWRVYISSDADVVALTSGEWDVLESRGADYLRILGDDTVSGRLRTQGYRVESDEVIPAAATRAPMTYYYGYHTVAEHEAHLDTLAALRPDLARSIMYGTSWRKTQALARADGHDLMAQCITRITP
jgi:carboxypeptidase T